MLRYYYHGVPSWNWYYPFHYGPMLQDMKALAAMQRNISFALGQPFTPYQQLLAPVLAGSSSDAELLAAVDYARSNNLKLLALMNELTTDLEAVASERANTLRLVQTGGKRGSSPAR